MSARGLPRPFRHPSDRTLVGYVPPHFEQFYRSELRFCTGARIRTRDVGARYAEWSARVNAPSMSEKAIKRAMVSIGHDYFMSNGSFFRDAALALSVPDVVDNFPESSIVGEQIANPILGAICRIQDELEQLRRSIVKQGGWVDP
jgi:hypothetical protein